MSTFLPDGIVNKIYLPNDKHQAQLVFASELLGKEPELSVLLESIMDTVTLFKDPSTWVLVLTDTDSDPLVQPNFKGREHCRIDKD